TRLRTQTRELRNANSNRIVAIALGVRKRLEDRLRRFCGSRRGHVARCSRRHESTLKMRRLGWAFTLHYRPQGGYRGLAFHTIGVGPSDHVRAAEIGTFMRLSKIKLAGFKTFVDPTTIKFPSNLMGIVGPNGCGKSNIIDAIRWVLGESSAKTLRGDSMADVIFNGSSTRKPVGQASVELVFDNSDRTITGAYANYNEVSVRRVVTRDGQSQYFLNGGRCRRKDITHILLGTGL